MLLATYIQFSDLLGDFFESKTPTPIAKKTINGIQRYGWILNSVNPATIGTDKRIPAINTIIDSASFIPFRDLKNNPKTSGSKNIKTKPSNLN